MSDKTDEKLFKILKNILFHLVGIVGTKAKRIELTMKINRKWNLW